MHTIEHNNIADMLAALKKGAKSQVWTVHRASGYTVKVFGTWAQVIQHDSTGIRSSGTSGLKSGAALVRDVQAFIACTEKHN